MSACLLLGCAAQRGRKKVCRMSAEAWAKWTPGSREIIFLRYIRCNRSWSPRRSILSLADILFFFLSFPSSHGARFASRRIILGYWRVPGVYIVNFALTARFSLAGNGMDTPTEVGRSLLCCTSGARPWCRGSENSLWSTVEVLLRT